MEYEWETKVNNLLEMKGISKWVETAIRPVPVRSHILNTWPTKAGPPRFPSELRDDILTVELSPEDDVDVDVDADEAFLTVDSSGETSSESPEENLSGRHTRDGVVFGGNRGMIEDMEVAALWRISAAALWRGWVLSGESMFCWLFGHTRCLVVVVRKTNSISFFLSLKGRSYCICGSKL